MEADLEDTSSVNETSLFMERIVYKPELLEQVFSHLTKPDLKSVRLVCKLWRDVTFLPSLNNKIAITLPESDSRQVSQMISSGFQISNLEFTEKTQMIKYCTEPFLTSFGTSLKKLVLRSQVFNSESKLNHFLDCCPNLEYLAIFNCSGLEVGIELCEFRFKLKELQIVSCQNADDNIVGLVTSLAPAITKFRFHHSDSDPSKSLDTTQFVTVLQQLCQTLTEIKVGCNENDRNNILDFNAMFAVPGLKLKVVVLTGFYYFKHRFDAIVAHQGNSLEDVRLSEQLTLDLCAQLEQFLRAEMPNLREFFSDWVDDAVNDRSKAGALRLLCTGLGESCPSLRKIFVGRLCTLMRKTATDSFAPHELCVKFNKMRDVQNEAVFSFVSYMSLHLMTKLKLNKVDLSHGGMANIIFTNCTNLTNLSLKQCNLTDASLMDGMERTLQMLWDGNDGNIDIIVFPIMNLTKVEVLNLSGNDQLTGFSVTRVIKFPHLRTLRLNKNDSICDPRFVQLALNNPSLQKVSFMEMGLIDDFIIEFVQNAPNLVRLNISDNPRLSDYALCNLARHEKLSLINVFSCRKITSDCVQFVEERNNILDVDTYDFRMCDIDSDECYSDDD